MRTVPLELGPPSRRRIGPFWIEEGIGLVVTGVVILLVAATLYALAIITNPSSM